MRFIELIITVTLGITVKSEQVWSVIDRPTVLDCSTQSIGNCHFVNPIKKKVHPSAGCSVVLDKVGDDDLGRWTCVVEDREVRVFDLAAALTPSQVRVETVDETFEAKCSASNARPRPEFVWYLDDIRIDNLNVTDFEDIDNFHYQSIVLTPQHSNKKLRCVIRHISLEQPQEASIVIKFKRRNNDLLIGLTLIAILIGFAIILWADKFTKTLKKNNTEPSQPTIEAGDVVRMVPYRASRFLVFPVQEQDLSEVVIDERQLNRNTRDGELNQK